MPFVSMAKASQTTAQKRIQERKVTRDFMSVLMNASSGWNSGPDCGISYEEQSSGKRFLCGTDVIRKVIESTRVVGWGGRRCEYGLLGREFPILLLFFDKQDGSTCLHYPWIGVSI